MARDPYNGNQMCVKGQNWLVLANRATGRDMKANGTAGCQLSQDNGGLLPMAACNEIHQGFTWQTFPKEACSLWNGRGKEQSQALLGQGPPHCIGAYAMLSEQPCEFIHRKGRLDDIWVKAK